MNAFGLPVIACGVIDTPFNAGGIKYSTVNGCIASGAGTGQTEITLLAPNDQFPSDRYLIAVFPGLGSAFSDGVTYGVSALGTGTYGRAFEVATRIATGVDAGDLIDMPFSFFIMLRPDT